MITVYRLAGTVPPCPQMPTRATDIPGESAEREDILAAADALAELAGASDGAGRARDAGQEIAAIVASLGLPADVLAAVRLTPLYRQNFIDETILSNNGLQELSTLIDELSQLSAFALPEDWRPGEALAVRQSEALRKMLLAVVSDVRLVLARIAEQLFRLRSAKQAAPAARRALALETREIYAPVASRLGVWQLKWELEDLAFRYLEPETYAAIARSLNEKRVERERFIDGVKATLEAELAAAGIRAAVSGRPKHIYSIWRKMQRKNRGLDALFDIRAVRLLVDDVRDCYAALGVVHKLWPYLKGEFDDYIANPKENDYRSLHTAVIGPEGNTLEVQIRTHEMHRQAELGVAAHWRYKEGGGAPAAFDQKIRALRQLLEPAAEGGELLDRLRGEVFEDRVYALSPKGDVVELPDGATPLDFAYHVHTEVGHRCRGAKVNDRIVPLTYRIANGDKVEIITGSQPQPSRDWLVPRLGYLAGSRSRAKVRSWFKRQDRDQHLRQGREILERELARLNMKETPTDSIARQLGEKDTEALSVLLGAGELTPTAIANALHRLRGEELPKPVRRRRRARRTGAPGGVAVSGIGDLMSSFAKCCRPGPPEAITGYITQGRGVSIHRQDCGNVLSLGRRSPDRVVEVDWGNSDDDVYPVDLVIRAFDRGGLLRDITLVLSDENANIVDMSTTTDKKSMETAINVSIEVRDFPTLSTILARIEQVANVTSVRRAQ